MTRFLDITTATISILLPAVAFYGVFTTWGAWSVAGLIVWVACLLYISDDT